jgi:hypothetical protein
MTSYIVCTLPSIHPTSSPLDTDPDINTPEITMKPEATDADVQSLKERIVAQGGSIGHEYTLIKGFRYAVSHSPLDWYAADGLEL